MSCPIPSALNVFKAHCPQCGKELGIKRDLERKGIELKPYERLFCPDHGDVMSLEEARRIAFEENRDDIINKAREFGRDSLQKGIREILKK